MHNLLSNFINFRFYIDFILIRKEFTLTLYIKTRVYPGIRAGEFTLKLFLVKYILVL